MKIIKNEKLINRNAKVGRYASLAGLAILGVGMWITFARPEWVQYSWASLFVGFILSQVGIYYGNRWGRRPRPDEHLDAALKGMDDRWTLIHYDAQSEHVLFGPGGFWLLKTYHQPGKLTYDQNKKRWKMGGGGFMQAYLRVFAQESIGRPDLEIVSETRALLAFIKKRAPDIEPPEIKVGLVMTNEKTEIDEGIQDAPAVPIAVKKLKETIRKLSKEGGISPLKLAALQAAYGVED
jgi:hypothetical protein